MDNECTGGLGYACPWLPYPATMITKGGEVYAEEAQRSVAAGLA